MNLTDLVLSIMLVLQPAGRSPYSLTHVAADAPKPCEGYSPLCRAPWFDRDRGSWVRVETAFEGQIRYQVIADAIANIASTDMRLAAFLLTVTFHESGWREDVHRGIGEHSKGDGGQSWCLGQIMLGRKASTKVFDYEARDLVGTDLDSTLRCMDVSARYLRHAMRKGAPPEVVLARYGGVRSTKDKRIQKRAATFARVTRLMAEEGGSGS